MDKLLQLIKDALKVDEAEYSSELQAFVVRKENLVLGYRVRERCIIPERFENYIKFIIIPHFHRELLERSQKCTH